MMITEMKCHLHIVLVHQIQMEVHSVAGYYYYHWIYFNCRISFGNAIYHLNTLIECKMNAVVRITVQHIVSQMILKVPTNRWTMRIIIIIIMAWAMIQMQGPMLIMWHLRFKTITTTTPIRRGMNLFERRYISTKKKRMKIDDDFVISLFSLVS